MTLGDYWTVLSNLNNTLGPNYRYETGTSIAAPYVSGMLALMEQFFLDAGHTNSPALMKALLINGARPVNQIYNFHVRSAINYEGWGLLNLTNSLPPTNLFFASIINQPAPGVLAPMIIFDQDPIAALATGQSWTRTVNVVDPAAQSLPLRLTLAWTDPPGNPAASVKLVNNLDLIVTNLDTGDVYYGNDIPSGANFNVPGNTNAPNFDSINNVENIFLPPPLGAKYSVTVFGRSVNVNAVTSYPGQNQVAQDYALVIASGNGQVANALELADLTPSDKTPPIVTAPTNSISGSTNDVGVFLLHQRVGANAPLLGTGTMGLGANPDWGANGVITIGLTNSWHFYAVTNTGGADFTNAAFATFLPPNLSLARMGVHAFDNPDNATRAQADIDLYVSTDPTLTNLNPTAIANADKSLSRGGTESIVYTDATPGGVYYIGVKAEDQEAAEYGFIVDFSNIPFGTDDGNGNENIRGLRLPMVIPDGSPNNPGVAAVVAISPKSFAIRRVVVTNTITHQDFGDLFGDLTHGSQFAVLNNHTFGNGDLTQARIYEDNEEGDVPGSQHTDGPGSLVNFMGEQSGGVWLLTEADNALSHTGQVDNLSIHLEPQLDLTGGIQASVGAFSFRYFFIDVPPDATNLTINILNNSSTPLPLQLLIRRGALPSLTTFDKQATIFPPGGSLSIGKSDLPPLQPGRYFIGVYNPNNISQDFFISAQLDLDLNGVQTINYTSANTVPILDDAVTYDTLDLSSLPANVNVFSVNVGVAIAHPRISDLVLSLISPGGTRTLLMENRGGLDPNGAGGSVTTTNVTLFNSDFESAAAGDYPPGATVDGWTVAGNQVSVVNDQPNANTGSQFLALAAGALTRTITTVPGNTYTLSYAYRGPGIVGMWRGENNGVDSIAGNNGTPQNIGFTNGVVGQAFACDPENYPFGTYSGVKIADQPAYVLTNSLSIEGWIRPRGNSYNVFWRGDNRPGVDPYVLSMQNSANLAFYIEDQANSPNISTPLVYGQWWHVAATFDGNSGTMRLYTNGVLASQTTTAVRPLGNLIPGDSPGLGIGNVNDGINNFPFWGDIDEISLYSRALSASEIGAIYSADGAGKFDNTAALPAALAKAQVSVGNAAANVLFGNNTSWQTNTVTFIATGTSQTVAISGLEPGMLIDSVKLATQETSAQYLVFTEDTSVAQLPIKFAATPFVGTGLPTGIPILAGPVTNPANGHYYYLLGGNTWTGSEAWAQALGGHLATINDAAENAWVYSTFSSVGGVPRGLWIGLYDPTQDANGLPHASNFVWVSGAPVTYTHWGIASGCPYGEPNNGCGSTPEYYTCVFSPTDGRASYWNDVVNDGYGGAYVSNGVVEVSQSSAADYFPEEVLRDVGERAGEWAVETGDPG